jgi:hypothetical protein
VIIPWSTSPLNDGFRDADEAQVLEQEAEGHGHGQQAEIDGSEKPGQDHRPDQLSGHGKHLGKDDGAGAPHGLRP